MRRHALATLAILIISCSQTCSAEPARVSGGGNVSAAAFISKPLIGTIFFDPDKTREFGLTEDSSPEWREWYRQALRKLSTGFKRNWPEGLEGFQITFDGKKHVYTATLCCPKEFPRVEELEHGKALLASLEELAGNLKPPPSLKSISLYLVADGRVRAVTMWTDDAALARRESHYTTEQLLAVPLETIEQSIKDCLQDTSPELIGELELSSADLARPVINRMRDPRPDWRNWYTNLFAYFGKRLKSVSVPRLDFDVTISADGTVNAKDLEGETDRPAATVKLAKATAKVLSGGPFAELRFPASSRLKFINATVAKEDSELVLYAHDQFLAQYRARLTAAEMRLNEGLSKRNESRMPPHIVQSKRVHHQPGDSFYTYTLEDR